MIIFKRFLFLLAVTHVNVSYSLFDLNTLLLLFKKRATVQEVWKSGKNVLSTSRDIIHTSFYTLGVGLTGLGAVGLFYLSFNAYKKFKQEKEAEIASAAKSSFSELFFPEQHEKNMAKTSAATLIFGLGLLKITEKHTK